MAVAYADFTALLTGCGFNQHARTVMADPDREGMTFQIIQNWKNSNVDSLTVSLRKAEEPVGKKVYVNENSITNLKTVCFFL